MDLAVPFLTATYHDKEYGANVHPERENLRPCIVTMDHDFCVTQLVHEGAQPKGAQPTQPKPEKQNQAKAQHHTAAEQKTQKTLARSSKAKRTFSYSEPYTILRLREC